MKINITSTIALIVAVVCAVLRLLPIGEVSLNAIRFMPIALSLLVAIVAYLNFTSMNKAGFPEKTVWLFFLFASIFNTFAMIVEVLPSVFPSQNSLLFPIVSSAFFFLCYISFIIGFWIESIKVETVVKKINNFLPLVINLVGFAVVTFFILQQVQSSDIQGIWAVTFITFVALDFILVGTCWAVTARTRGGQLSTPYLVISVGCILLVVFHIFTSFLTLAGMFSVDHPIRLILVLAMTVVTIGGDMRLAVQQKILSEMK